MEFMLFLLPVFAFVLFAILFALQVYGAVLGFRKAWYIGFLALAFGMGGIVLAVAKLVFKKDLLA